MRKTTTIAAALALAFAGTLGCAKKERARGNAPVAQDDPNATTDESVFGPFDQTLDDMDGAMRYEVAHVDMTGGQVVLTPVEAVEQEIDPQSGRELILTLDDFRRLAGKPDPTDGDVVQLLEPGEEILIFGYAPHAPMSAEEIERIEIPLPE